jgi:hypothetical protein
VYQIDLTKEELDAGLQYMGGAISGAKKAINATKSLIPESNPHMQEAMELLKNMESFNTKLLQAKLLG